MKPAAPWIQRLVAALLLAGGVLQAAEVHRATRLGNPRTRFAPPRTTPESVRDLLLDEKLKPDVASVLRQASWPGRVQDLWTAVRTARIEEIRLPVGTRMPFMASRRNGFPIALRNVVWAGKAPVEAYTFTFASLGRGWRLIMPKPCSNFYLVEEELPVARASLAFSGPAKASRCEPVTVRVEMTNTGNMPLQELRLELAAAETVLTNRAVADLAVGERRSDPVTLPRGVAGGAPLEARLFSAETLLAEAGTVIQPAAPRLVLECQAVKGQVGKPGRVCLTVRNVGSAAEPAAWLEATLPEGLAFRAVGGQAAEQKGAVRWTLGALAAGAEQTACLELVSDTPLETELAARAGGDCAEPVESRCPVSFAGVPAVLLEVVDLQDPVAVGDPVDYEIRVTNQGSAPLTGLRLRLELPASQTFLESHGPTAIRETGEGIVSERLPVLEPKQTATWRVRVQATRHADARFLVQLLGDQFPRPIPELEATTQY